MKSEFTQEETRVAIELARLAPEVPAFNVMAMIVNPEAQQFFSPPAPAEEIASMLWVFYRPRWERARRQGLGS